MKKITGLKQRERTLLVAQLVYQEAITRHRAERSELTRRMASEAQEHLARVRRYALLTSWGQSEPPVVTCPRCGDAPRSTTWNESKSAKQGDSAGLWSDVPEWAERYMGEGVESITRYHCDRCDFEIAMLARETA
ncbi:MAG: hypothetical protein V3T05_08375 [Myxococcota bacterium]